MRKILINKVHLVMDKHSERYYVNFHFDMANGYIFSFEDDNILVFHNGVGGNEWIDHDKHEQLKIVGVDLI